MGSPFKSRNVHLFQDFSGNGIRHVMGFPVIHTEKLGQGGGVQLHEQYCISNNKIKIKITCIAGCRF